ncbi:MAG: nicotinamide-nucleotide amidase [Campylobacterota bacterium]|nr:nicotinamide-nucleotide amidase [Campylobacterota bacterium]
MNTLIVINQEVEYSKEYINYIKREYEKSSKIITNTIIINETDKDLFLIIKSAIMLSKTMLIVASKRSFAIVGKFFCTLSDSQLEQKENMLLPKKAELFEINSYLITINNCLTNVVLASLEKNLPKILIHKKTAVLKLNLFGIEPQDAQTLLHEASEIYHTKIESYKHIGGWTILNLYTNISSDINHFLDYCESLFPNKIIIADDVVEHIVLRLTKLGKKITFAESCTGGRVASLFTKVSGSSAVFEGSMVTYSNEIKSSWLGVNKSSLISFGAVSTTVVEEMAIGAINKSNADYSLAISGVAGPSGGTVEKPIGTVYIAAANKENTIMSERLSLVGDRELIQIASAYNAIRLLIMTNLELF